MLSFRTWSVVSKFQKALDEGGETLGTRRKVKTMRSNRRTGSDQKKEVAQMANL